MRIDFRRWGVFNLVGFAGFVVQISAIALLTRVFEWPSFVATVIGLELAALQNFFAHSRFTWGDAPAGGVRATFIRFWRYQLAKAVWLGANLGITTFLIYSGDLKVGPFALPEVANAVAVLLCAVPNYVMSGHYVFGYTSRPCSPDAMSSKAV